MGTITAVCPLARTLNMSQSTVFNKLSCHSSNSVTIMKVFKIKIQNALWTRPFSLHPLMEIIFTHLLTIFALLNDIVFPNYA